MAKEIISYTCLLPVCLLLIAAVNAATEPLHCAQCTEEKLALCPQIPPDCPELAREQGCGCCLTCALKQGEACGVYTARCGKALTCKVKSEEPRPLYALTRGQGICMDAEDLEKLKTSDTTEVKDYSEHESTAPESIDLSQDQLPPFLRLFPDGFDKFDAWNAITVYESMKAKKLFDRKKLKEQYQGPCQKDLYRAMDRLIRFQQTTGEDLYRFHIPNCNRNGFYHSKQCETALDGERGKCWCVFPLTGKKIPGSPENRGDLNCQQYLKAQE